MRVFSRLGRSLHWVLRLLLVLLVVDLAYVAWLWPDWDRLARGPIPKTSFMRLYEEQRQHHKNWQPLSWHPVPLSKIPRHLVRAVLLGEDSRFYTHSGFDVIAIREALDYNLAEGSVAFGASTISQQTAKNLFLSPARTPWRKWHETLLTFGLEQHLKKRRILEIYLNTAEFGRGIYGVDAAARAYWGVPVENLSVFEAAELAATLPGPTKHNPATRTAFFERRTRKILNLLAHEFDVAPKTEPSVPIAEPENTPPAAGPLI
jgi:monofunctional biosynthetic peptidoglycan transglycosylase